MQCLHLRKCTCGGCIRTFFLLSKFGGHKDVILRCFGVLFRWNSWVESLECWMECVC